MSNTAAEKTVCKCNIYTVNIKPNSLRFFAMYLTI